MECNCLHGSQEKIRERNYIHKNKSDKCYMRLRYAIFHEHLKRHVSWTGEFSASECLCITD